MPEYKVFKPSEAVYHLNEWDRTRICDLPENVGGFELKAAVEEDVMVALFRRGMASDEREAEYRRVVRAPLADADGLIDVATIMDEWVTAATFDPERVTTKEGAWALVSDKECAIVTAKLVDSEMMPNGKDWEVRGYRWVDSGNKWVEDEYYSPLVPSAECLGYYAKSIKDIDTLMKTGPEGVVHINQSKILPGLKETEYVDAVRIAPIVAREEYLNASKRIEDVYDISWELVDRPSYPNLASMIIERGRNLVSDPITAKAGPFDITVSVELEPVPHAKATIAYAPEPGSDAKQRPYSAACYIKDEKSVVTAALAAAKEAIEKEGFRNIKSIRLENGHFTRDFEDALKLAFSNFIAQPEQFPHPQSFEERGLNRFVGETEDFILVAKDHGEAGWAISSKYDANPRRVDYGATFADAYASAFKAQKAELELSNKRTLAIENPRDRETAAFTSIEELGAIDAPSPRAPTPEPTRETKAPLPLPAHEAALSAGKQRPRAAK